MLQVVFIRMARQIYQAAGMPAALPNAMPYINGNGCWPAAVFYKLLGIRVQWHGAQHLPAGRHVIVSNHVTVRSMPVHLACAT